MSTINDIELVDGVEEKSKPSTRAKKPKELTESKKPKDTAIKKLDPQAAKLLSSLSLKANKKDYGQKIRDSEIIYLGLQQITDEHLESLQQKSIRGKDRQTLAYEKYQKENGKISLDEFLNKVFSGEIKISNS